MELGVTYIPAHHPNHIGTDITVLADMGCTEVLFALQENHLKTLTGALRFGARIAQDSGLRPYAVVWGYANTFGGGRMSHLLLQDRSVWRIQADGTPQALACLNHPGLIDRFVEIAETCLDHGYQGMFIDEPQAQDCFCDHCQERFAEGFGASLTSSVSSAAYRAFQQQTVLEYVTQVCRRVKALDPDLTTLACIMPTPPHDQLFEPVAAVSDLDVFGTDPYWLLSDAFSFDMTLEDACDTAARVKALCRAHGKSSQIWLNCWRIPAGRESEVYTGGMQLAAVGCDSLYTWSFRGGLGTDEECDNPTAAWHSVLKLYRELAAANAAQ